MECRSLKMVVVYLCCSYCILFGWCVIASRDCEFPAIFNFGDSNSDTGGMVSAFPAALRPPYGETLSHEPATRYSDGRLLIDFIAKSFGLPYLNAYLDSLWPNFKHGANFATSASTIRLPDHVLPKSGFSPFYLDVQYTQFARLKARAKAIQNQGGTQYANSVPLEDYFKNALYTFDIGQNDLGEGIFGNKSLQEVKASVPNIINHFQENFKSFVLCLFNSRSFWIHNTGPIGCLPYILVTFPSAERDKVGCAKPHNQVAQYFNDMLKQAVVQLRKDFPSAAITYVDVYSAKYSLFVDPHKYGFELPLVACCGYGGEYNYSSFSCGLTITVKGSQVFVGSCGRESFRVNWDGIHYTEAANKVVFDKISTGAFSDPPIPLNKACLRN
ncbi:hypothetical protein UlMin_034618 [Ulmus minor]